MDLNANSGERFVKTYRRSLRGSVDLNGYSVDFGEPEVIVAPFEGAWI